MEPKAQEAVRQLVGRYLDAMPDAGERRVAYGHLEGVAQLATLLAFRRGLNAELATVAGLVHDLYSYATGIRVHHAASGAEMVRPMLRDTGLFATEEVLLVVSAVFHHSDKVGLHSAYDELLKDADVLQHHLRNPRDRVSAAEAARLTNLAAELGTRPAWVVGARQSRRHPPANTVPLAQRVADIAEALAAKGIAGVPGNADYEAICRPFTGSDVLAEFHTGWCAAFVYACCQRAGLRLPMRHPRVSCRFGAVRGWLEWAQLDGVGLYRDAACEPCRGDIVIYDDVLRRGPHDHIGIVVEVGPDSLRVAEGNADDRNVGAIVVRARTGHIRGVVRLTDSYAFAWTGEPDWAV